MPTLVWMTGWEHGVNPTTSGGGLANAISGSPAVVTSPVHTGTYALRCNPAGAAQYMQKTITGDRMILRIYLYFAASLPGADSDLLSVRDAGSQSLVLRYVAASNKFGLRYGTDAFTLSGNTIVADHWYCIEINALTNANPHLASWKVDGTDQTQVSSAQTASTVAALRIGTGSAQTFTCYYDDLLVSVTNADYPLGAGGVSGLSPNAEGTHNPGTNEIEDNAGADINGSTVQAYPLMDNVPMNSTTDYVQQATAHTVPDAHYAEVGFADIAAGLTVKGVIGLLAYKSSSTTANKGSTIAIRSDATQIEIYGTPAVPVDYSESSLFYKSVVITAPGGGWTQSEVNALKMRVGGSSDASPLPQWHALMFEVDTVTESTPKADSDTAIESETSSLAVTAPVADTETVSEAVSLEAVATATDAAALSEGTPDVAQDVSDAATESETAALAVSATPTDAAALGEATDIAASATATDTGTESEAAALEATPNVTDAAALSEVASLAASATATDAATEGETAALAASITHTDAAALSEAAQAEAQASGADTFTLGDTGSVQQSGGDQSLEAQDAFALAESAALAASATPTDALALGDAAALTADLAGVDAAALSEGTPDVSQDVSDAAAETEAAALAASATITDALAFAEATQTEAQASGADTATLTDLGTVAGEGEIIGQDAFALTESAVVTVSVSVTEAFAFTETTVEISLALIDAFVISETFLIGVMAGAGDAFSLLDLAVKAVIHIVPPLDADVIVGGVGISPRGVLDTSASLGTKQTDVTMRGSGTTDVEVLP